MLAAIAALTLLGASAEAQLPKNGTARFHSGWKAVVEAREVGKNHLYSGEYFGMWFNDEGTGFLHRTQWLCVFINDVIDGQSQLPADVRCTATDGDGDQIATVAKTKSPKEGFDFAGLHTLRRGTGKYSGIEGTITYDCKVMGKYDQVWCIHEANYRLP